MRLPNFYLLNVKPKNVEITAQKAMEAKNTPVSYWLEHRKQAPIFYDTNTIKSLLEKKSNLTNQRQISEAYTFCDVGKNKKNFQHTIITTIGDNHVWIYMPRDDIKEEAIGKTYKGIRVKYIPIAILAKKKLKETPLTLASMKANAFLRNGTFINLSELDPPQYKGNIYAIEYIRQKEKKKIKIDDDFIFLYLLSSLELETLVAKLFEENNFFVSAYKGGYLKDIDLVVKNLTSDKLTLGKITVEADGSSSIQVKVSSQLHEHVNAEYSLSIEQDEDWFIETLNKSPQTKNWLKRVLHWVEHKEL